MPEETLPKLLLLEDDPVSAAFLGAVLEALPATVDCCASCAGAESLALASAHALWIFDANLPDGSGVDLLRRLRASGQTTPAIALTAESLRERLDALSAAGFSLVLQKPISADALTAAMRTRLPDAVAAALESSPTASGALWDEGRALAAVGGKPESARVLRELFLEELPAQADGVRLAFALSDHQAIREHLHRLKASCGLVGADRLLAAVNRLASGMDATSLQDFLDAARLQRQARTFTPDVA